MSDLLRNLLVLLVCSFLLSTAYYRGACMLTSSRPAIKQFALFALITYVCVLLNNIVFTRGSAPAALVSMVGLPLYHALLFRKCSFSLVLTWFILLAFYMLADAGLGNLCVFLLGAESMAALNDLSSPRSYILYHLLGAALIHAAIFVIQGVRWLYKRLRSRYPRGPVILPVLRPLLLIIATVLSASVYVNQLYIDYPNININTLLILIMPGLLALICITYIWQDFTYLQQLRRNQTLEHWKDLSDILLQDTRYFRHNIANMLYGFEGAIFSNDVKKIRAYYDQMIQRCVMVNNENVVNLQRIPSISISALLLNKIEQANARRVPFYVLVEEPLHWRSIPEADLCEMLGVLVDNAMEAAQIAPTQLVTIEIRNVESMMELIVKNTFAEQNNSYAPEAFGISTKAGHEGIGLPSVQRIVKKHPGIAFNLRVVGRYVEAQLLFS